MSRYNQGLIYTNDNCIRCNRCISQCPVMGANSAVMGENGSKIEVNSRYCIECARCIDVCKHSAREYRDDTDRFLNDLKNGKQISLAVSRSFYEIYRDAAARALGYLKSLGAAKIYDVAFGVDICAWLYLEYFRRNAGNDDRAFISSICPAVNNYITKRMHGASKSLIPIQTPLVCLGLYVKKHLSDDRPIASISPCVAMKDEIELAKTKRVISYNVTIGRLMKRLSKVDLTPYEAARPDLSAIGFGNAGCTRDGFRRYMEYLANDIGAVAHGISPVESVNAFQNQIKCLLNGARPLFLDITGCLGGCVASPSTTNDKSLLVNAFCANLSSRNDGALAGDIPSSARREKLYAAFKELNYDDYTRTFAEEYRQQFALPDDAYEEIFASMYKNTEQSRRVNCHLCGYDSCIDMATAIAYGYSQKDDCIQYAKERIARLNSYDTLTGLLKESAAVDTISRIIADKPDRDYVIGYVKINNLKVVNEIYGFDTGDRVINFFAEKLRTIATKDGVCARIGSESAMFFTIDRPGIDGIFDDKKYFDMGFMGMDMRLTVTIVLYALKKGETNLRHAIGSASLACGYANDAVNRIVRYTDEMRKSLENEASITSQMHLALARDEFKIYLQPQYNHSTGELSGAEALCRWIKSDATVVSPGEFIPIFEKNGFIRELDKRMWEKAFALMRAWLDRGLNPVAISTNISRLSITREDIVDDFKALIDRYKIPARLIHLEITESAYMSNQKQIISIVTSLQRMGFTIAMDDFGSGYSSLNTLKDVPFDILKLDMGFFKGEDSSRRSGNIVSSIMRMANGLKLISIAEGVEKLDQADYLKSLGCDIIQGYLYSKPIPVEEYENLLISSKRQLALKKPTIMEYIDINSFSSPSSGESKMFNSYVGPAAIIEHKNNFIEIIRANDKYMELLGTRGMEFSEIANYVMRQTNDADRRECLSAIAKAIETGTEATSVMGVKNATDGKTVYIRNHFFVIAKNGDSDILYCLADNVTNEKNAHNNLLIAYNRMNLILDNVSTCLCLYKIEVSVSRIKIKPLTVNKAYTELIGYDLDELSRMDFKDFINKVHPDDRKDMIRAVINALATTNNLKYVYRTYSKSLSNYINVRLDARAVKDADGSVLALLNITRLNA